jgi:hypothetical protein
MINKIFGNPKYPSTLENCELILYDGKSISIGNVYLFDSDHYLRLYKFGEKWAKDLIFSKKRIVGYFYLNGYYDNQRGAKEIICRIGENITYKIEKISFNKMQVGFNSSETYSIIKFIALNSKTITEEELALLHNQ